MNTQEYKIKGWVARDKDGGLYIGERKPYRNEFESWIGYGRSVKLFHELLPDITWEDEPIEVELTIKKI